MDKKKIAKLFFETFRTRIKTIVTLNSPESELDDTCVRIKDNIGEIVFRNHADYEKASFTKDFKSFGKKLADEYGVEFNTIYHKEATGSKNFYYKFDPEQIVVVDGVKFRMGRRMMNMPHAVLDGVSHRYYIAIYDLELVEEIKKLQEEKLAKEEAKKKAEFPAKKQEAITQCQDMIDTLTAIVNGEVEIDERNLWRIKDAYFDICVMIGSYV